MFWGLLVAAAACGRESSKLFERNSPEVDHAIGELDAGAAEAGTGRLGRYLSTPGCDAGSLYVPGPADASNASFDMGLGLFQIAEKYGRRFGEPPPDRDAGSREEQVLADLRDDQVDCARMLLDSLLAHPLPADLEARARYLRGNLAFLAGKWEDAIKDYDGALRVIPGIEGDAGDAIGADVAWNRALALRNKDDEDKKKDAGNDGNDAPDAQDDAQEDAGDGGKDSGPDSGDSGGEDSGDDGGANADGGDAGADAKGDSGKDDGKDGGPENRQPDAGEDQPSPQNPPTPTEANQDDRMLDQFEQAPTWQREEAKSRRQVRHGRGMQDK
jgi:tetratricopeptide (TPR) repeat protein